MAALHEQRCQRLDDGQSPLDDAASTNLLEELASDWKILDDPKSIQRTYSFGNYYETMAFVNVAAMIAHQQDHHPDMTVSYNKCTVTYSTHSVGGLSLNDFICAAKTDRATEL